MSLRSVFPTTRFLGKLLSMSLEDLRNASAEKASKGYGIREDFAASYIRQQQALRGVR